MPSELSILRLLCRSPNEVNDKVSPFEMRLHLSERTQDRGSSIGSRRMAARAAAYLEARGRNDPSRLPLAPDVRYRENCQTLALGKGLWATATPFEVGRPHFVDVVEPASPAGRPASGATAWFGGGRGED